MRTKEDVEQYMIDMDLDFEEIREGFYHVNDDLEDINDIYIIFPPPIVTFMVRLMPVPEQRKEEFYQLLLELNGQMLAGADSIENHTVCLSDTLQTENLDFNELQASLESIATALVEDYPQLAMFKF